MIPQYSQPGVQVFPDGREVCLLNLAAGRRVYFGRIQDMASRQDHSCCLFGYCPFCPGSLHGHVTEFEHEFCKGAGRQDDRIILPTGQWLNGVAHRACNQWKSSRRIPYNAGNFEEV